MTRRVRKAIVGRNLGDPGGEMEPLVIPTEELDDKDRETRNVRAWRVEQLRSLGLP
jgi:hypothetical protein